MRSRWDQLDVAGIALSSVCFVHCLLSPILLTALPFLFVGPAEFAATTLMILGASIAIVHGYFHHGKILPLLAYLTGITAFILGRVLGLAELPSALAMSVFFVSAHTLNFRLCRLEQDSNL